ncbi:MAG: YceI family protein [Chloroflexi bacterium]|nr:MAG: YceI family protein [Chloroflexota bacterium]
MLKDKTMMGGIALLFVGVAIALGLWVLLLQTSDDAIQPISSEPITSDIVSSGVDATVDFVTFEIAQAESEARYSLGELLRGQPKTVVGSTNQVAGQLIVNLNELASTEVGLIRINTWTLLTDNNLRNNAIRSRILFTDEFEFITFNPTEISGLPDRAAVGEPVTFEMTGELTIKDVTQVETFVVTAVAPTPSRLEGSATATILRDTYQLVVPNVSSVANVDEEVVLEIDFVALPLP